MVSNHIYQHLILYESKQKTNKFLTPWGLDKIFAFKKKFKM